MVAELRANGWPAEAYVQADSGKLIVWMKMDVRDTRVPEEAMTPEPVTGDDSVHCRLCGKETSVAMIVHHLEHAHGISPQQIIDAPIVDDADEDAIN